MRYTEDKVVTTVYGEGDYGGAFSTHIPYPGPGFQVSIVVSGTATLTASDPPIDFDVFPAITGSSEFPAVVHALGPTTSGASSVDFASNVGTWNTSDVEPNEDDDGLYYQAKYQTLHPPEHSPWTLNLHVVVDVLPVAVPGNLEFVYRWSEMGSRWFPKPNTEQKEALLLLELNMRALEDYLRTLTPSAAPAPPPLPVG